MKMRKDKPIVRTYLAITASPLEPYVRCGHSSRGPKMTVWLVNIYEDGMCDSVEMTENMKWEYWHG